MISLVSLTDLQSYKYIADSVKNSVSWPQFVSEAEMLDVKNWLGDGLLMEIVTQSTPSPTTVTAANQLLLDGGTYVYLTRTFHFQGLRAAIMYYAFARFTNRTSFNYTAAGIVLKDSDLSTPATTKDIQRLETEARLTAEAIKCEVIAFLNRNHLSYPLWHESGMCGCRGRCNDNRPYKVVGD